MDYHMLFQGHHCRINFLTSTTFVEDLITVNLEVLFQKTMFLKYLFADVTFKSLLSMSSFLLKNNFPILPSYHSALVFTCMLCEMRRLQNHLSANLTLMFGIFLVIYHQVSPEVCHGIERFATIVACVNPAGAVSH